MLRVRFGMMRDDVIGRLGSFFCDFVVLTVGMGTNTSHKGAMFWYILGKARPKIKETTTFTRVTAWRIIPVTKRLIAMG